MSALDRSVVPNAARLMEMVHATADAPQLLARLGIKHPEDLVELQVGSGAFARAFVLPTGKVLKLTTDEADAEVSELIRRQGPVPGLVRVFEVVRFPSRVAETAWDPASRVGYTPSDSDKRGEDLFGIVVEPVRPLIQLLDDEFGTQASRDRVGHALQQSRRMLGLADVEAHPDQLLIARAALSRETWGDPPDRDLLQRAVQVADEEGADEYGMSYLYSLTQGWLWMFRHGFRTRDLHSGNVGVNAAGDAVILDLGMSASAKSQRPEIQMASNPSVGYRGRPAEPGPYYHGTTTALRIDDVILPPTETGKQTEHRGQRRGKVFLSNSIRAASHYAERAAAKWGGQPIVYEVEPQGALKQMSSAQTRYGPIFHAPKARVLRAVTEDNLMTPNPSPNVDTVFDEAFDRIEEVFPDLGTIEFYEDEKAGSDNGAGSERQFAYCQDGNPISIAFAPKAKHLSDAHLRGLMRHEFGHALEYRYGVRELEKRLGRRLPDKVERRADAIAEAVWGEPIIYDEKFVQCVGVNGTAPRPAHLPDAREKLKANGQLRYRILDKGSVGFLVTAYDGRARIGHIGVFAPDATGWASVARIAVEPEYQRRGIGTELYRRASEEACSRGGKGLRSREYSRSPAASRTWEALAGAVPAKGGHELPCALEANPGGKLLGYKVMRFENGRAISGADSRQGFVPRKGEVLRMPGKGIFLSPLRDYVLTHYSGHDCQVLLTLEFRREDITSGDLNDREPELSVREATIVDFEVMEDDDLEENPSSPTTVADFLSSHRGILKDGALLAADVARIAKGTGLSESAVRRELKDLVAAGTVEEDTTLRRVHHHTFGRETAGRQQQVKIYRWIGPASLRPNPSGDTVTLPAGSLLFHGSLEPFDAPLRPGGDGVLWFADNPTIAQLYIPCSGLSMYASPGNLVRPTQDPSTQALQRYVGLIYDYDQVKFDSMGRATSWYSPEGFDGTPSKEQMAQLMRDAGFTVPEGWEPQVEIRMHLGDDGQYAIVPPGECREGRLFIARTRRDMKIYVMSQGEGDLTEVQYNEFDFFEALEERGFDGLLIDDFAQSEGWGNFGHMSIGLFAEAADDLDVESRPAQYEEIPDDRSEGYATSAYPEKVRPYFHLLQEGS